MHDGHADASGGQVTRRADKSQVTAMSTAAIGSMPIEVMIVFERRLGAGASHGTVTLRQVGRTVQPPKPTKKPGTGMRNIPPDPEQGRGNEAAGPHRRPEPLPGIRARPAANHTAEAEDHPRWRVPGMSIAHQDAGDQGEQEARQDGTTMPSIPIRMIDPGTHVVAPRQRHAPAQSRRSSASRRGSGGRTSPRDVGVAFEGGRVLAAVVGAGTSTPPPPGVRRARTKACWAPHRSCIGRRQTTRCQCQRSSVSVNVLLHSSTGTRVPSEPVSHRRGILPVRENFLRAIVFVGERYAAGPARMHHPSPRRGRAAGSPRSALLGYHPPHPRGIARGHRREEDRDHEVHEDYTHLHPRAWGRMPPRDAIRSTDDRGLVTASGEIIDNSVDGPSSGHCGRSGSSSPSRTAR